MPLSVICASPAPKRRFSVTTSPRVSMGSGWLSDRPPSDQSWAGSVCPATSTASGNMTRGSARLPDGLVKAVTTPPPTCNAWLSPMRFPLPMANPSRPREAGGSGTNMRRNLTRPADRPRASLSEALESTAASHILGQ